MGLYNPSHDPLDDGVPETHRLATHLLVLFRPYPHFSRHSLVQTVGRTKHASRRVQGIVRPVKLSPQSHSHTARNSTYLNVGLTLTSTTPPYAILILKFPFVTRIGPLLILFSNSNHACGRGCCNCMETLIPARRRSIEQLVACCL
jgi:hypothetical protein